jgi:hypothetical protein
MTTVKTEALWVIITVKKHKISFLLDTEAHFSAIPFSPGLSSLKLLFKAYRANL